MKKLCLLFMVVGLNLLAQQSPVKWSYESKKVSDCEYDLIFKAVIDEPWHIYSIHKNKSKEAQDIFPTEILFKKSPDFSLVGTLKESKPVTEFDKVWETVVSFHPKNATFTQRIKLNTQGSIKIKGSYEAQACTDEMCTRPPVDKFEIELKGSPACVTPAKEKETFGMEVSDKVCVCDTAAILAG